MNESKKLNILIFVLSVHKCSRTERVLVNQVNACYFQINYFYLKTVIFVLIVEYKALPLVLQEAKICGFRCVSFDFDSGPNEVINNQKDRFFVSFPVKQEFDNKINLLIENEELRKRFGQAAHQDIINRYNPEKIYSMWEELFIDMAL